MNIPTVDLSPFYRLNQEEMIVVANQIDQACQNIGAFYVTNSNLLTFSNDSATLNELLRFFDLPIETKNKISAKKNVDHRGYGSTETLESDEYREWLYLGDEDGDSYEKNQWLDENELPGWKNAITTNFKLMSETGSILYQAFSLALGADKDYLWNEFHREPTVLLLRYPQGGRCSEHTDVGFLAINLLDPVGGLQVKARHTDQWLDVPARENTFLCHIGDALERITNNRWYSVPHRVKHDRPGYRHGIVMFNNPHAESVIAPLNSNDEQENEQIRIIYKDFHREKMNQIKY